MYNNARQHKNDNKYVSIFTRVQYTKSLIMYKNMWVKDVV